ncbi:MAG: AAA family ATPase [Pseudomonas sp.]
MKITSLEITNFAAIGEATFALDDKGLILIQGKNEDDTSQESNGAGKSTVPDALCWALFGSTAKGQSGDKIVNRKAKKEASVIVTLLDDDTGDVYKVSRYRKSKTFKNMLRLELEDGAKWVDLTKGTDALTQDMVNRVIGCTHEVFTAAIYAGQEAMPDLPGMTDKQLKVLVEESAGIAQLQNGNDIARRIMTERKGVVQDIVAKIGAKQAGLDVLNTSLSNEQDAEATYEADRVTNIANAEANVTALKAAFDPTLGDKIAKKITQLTGQEDDTRKKIAGTDDERKQERQLSDDYNTANMASSQAAGREKNAAQALAQAEHRLTHIADTVGTDCASCGHTIEAGDVAGNEAVAKKNVAALKQALEVAQKEALEASESVTASAKALQEYRAAMTDVSAMTAQLDTIATNKGKLQTAATNWKSQQRGVEQAEQSVDSIKKAANPHTAQIANTQARIGAAEAEMVSLEHSRVVAADAFTLAEMALKVFSPQGVRSHILDTVTPHLNARTSHYLSTLTDGNISAVWSTISSTAKGELREKFNIDVTSQTGGESFVDLSGGEKRKVRLACAMALQDLVASRANKPIQLWVADEIDHALDGAGIERLMAILEDKARDKGTVLVISHTDLSDNIRQAITMTKKGGKSTLEPTTFV